MTETDIERTSARLYVSEPLAAGAAVEIAGDRAHYLRNVLRLEPGAAVALFNGRDGEWQAVVESLGKQRGRLRPVQQRRPQAAEPDGWLLFAPVKRARIDLIAEKATELGVARLLPVLTRRTNVARVNTGRLRAIAVEAAEQCERLSVPEVAEPVRLEAALADWPPGRRLVWGDESGGGAPAAAVLRGLQPGPWALLIGPEGGYAPGELDLLAALTSSTAVGLGPRVLRADTAVVAGLTLLQSHLGDWHHAPRNPADAPPDERARERT